MPVPGNPSSGRPEPVTAEEIAAVRGLLMASSVEPRPVMREDGMFEFPYLGQLHPGDDQYRQWLCQTLEMRDMIEMNSQLVAPPPPTGGNQEKFFEDTNNADALFFLDS
jgi:hypothetical protein